MKNLTFIGLVLFTIGALLFYLNNSAFDLRVFYGCLSGIGIGLIIGGLVGYISKGNAVKEAKIREEFKQLQKDKIAFEKAQENSSQSNSNDTNQNL